MGTDHGGYALKEDLKGRLIAAGYEVLDFGTDSEDSVDYPDFVGPAARAVASGDADRGVVLCGSGAGRVDHCRKDHRHSCGDRPRRLHGPPGGRTRRHECDRPRRAGDRAGAGLGDRPGVPQCRILRWRTPCAPGREGRRDRPIALDREPAPSPRHIGRLSRMHGVPHL